MAAGVEACTVCRTVGSGEQSVGYLVNRALWNGRIEGPPETTFGGVADPDGKYPIGSTCQVNDT